MRTKLSNIKCATVLIDFSNQVWKNHHGTLNKMTPNSDGIHTGSIVGLCKTITQSITKAKEVAGLFKLVICEDRKPTRKREIYYNNQDAFIDYAPDKSFFEKNLKDENLKIRYKGNRNREELDYDPIQICKDFISCIPHTKIYCDGEEADDVLAAYISNHKDENIFLYSTDKDLWQLLGKFNNLKIFLDGDGREPTDKDFEKNFSTLCTYKIPLHKIITGDSGDNVKGVKRFPFKKSLDAFTACDGTVESFFENVYKLYGENSRAMELLLKYINLIRINYELVTLKVDLDYTEEFFSTPDKHKWQELCHIYETPSLMRLSIMEMFS